MVVLVGLEVAREVFNPATQHRYLDFGGTCIAWLRAIFCDDFLLYCSVE
jgi:hypothetical protein